MGRITIAMYRTYGQLCIILERGCSVRNQHPRAVARRPKIIQRHVILGCTITPKHMKFRTPVKHLTQFVCLFVMLPWGGHIRRNTHTQTHIKVSSGELASATYFNFVFPRILVLDLLLVARLMKTQLPHGGPPKRRPPGTKRSTKRMQLMNPHLNGPMVGPKHGLKAHGVPLEVE